MTPPRSEDTSRGERMGHAVVEDLGGWILGETQDVAAGATSQSPRMRDQQDLTVALAITVTRLLRSPKRAWGVVVPSVLLLCLPLLPAPSWDRLATITDIESDATGSAHAHRDGSLGALRSVLSRSVVSASIGADVLALTEQVGPSWSAVHNAYLQYGMALGLPSLGLFLALFATCLASGSAAQHGVRSSRDSRDAVHP